VIRHAGLIALRLAGQWRGALLEGPSGAGKSDLALRALEAGFQLVADDRVLVWRSGGALYGRAPATLSGWIEARGQGLLQVMPLRLAEISLAVTCVPGPEGLERLPDPSFETILGVSIQRLMLNPFEHSAPAKLRRVMECLGSAARQGYHSDPLGGPRRAGTGETP